MQSLAVGGPSPASARFFKLCARLLRPIQIRHESSYRRSRSKLNIKPDPSFLPTKTEQHDHIVYNPPPSMPNVYHTPTIFLPKDDKRRAMQSALQPYSQAQPNPERLPMLRQSYDRRPYEKRYHLTGADVKEIRALRIEDPVKWSRNRLAEKFDCSPIFIGTITGQVAHEERVTKKREQQRLVADIVRSNWGVKRRTAREDRAIRKDRWFRDE